MRVIQACLRGHRMEDATTAPGFVRADVWGALAIAILEQGQHGRRLPRDCLEPAPPTTLVVLWSGSYLLDHGDRRRLARKRGESRMLSNQMLGQSLDIAFTQVYLTKERLHLELWE